MGGTEAERWGKLTQKEKDDALYKFDKPGKELRITQEMRQQAFDNYETTDDQRLRVSGSTRSGRRWPMGGDIRNANGQTWECFQAHDPEITPGIVPGDPAWFTFWRPLHGKSPETARPFVPVMGAHDMYRAGEYMIYTDGQTYRCKSDTNYSPEEYAQAWEVV